jgi:hypothetical protein
MENQLLKDRHEFCIRYANSMMTMIKLYEKQGDRQESIKQCALEGKIALVEAKRIEMIWSEQTVILMVA